MSKRDREDESQTKAEPLFRLKEFVTVAERKHPGFNWEGGAGKIVKVNYEGGPESASLPPLKDGSENGQRTTDYTYNVKYVLGGSEKRIDAQWIVSKDPLKVERAELTVKRAKISQEKKEAKAALEAEKQREMERLLEEKRKKRAAARESSLAMVKKIRAELKAKKEKEEKRKKKQKDQQKKTKKKSLPKAENTKENNKLRSPLVPTTTKTNSLTPVKMNFEQKPSQEKSCTKATAPVNMEKVKLVMTALTRIEKQFRTGEVELEKLKDDLVQNGCSDLAADDTTIENTLAHLQEENRVMYREEVIWII